MTEHYPAIFKLFTRLDDAEGTLQCHLFICQQKRDADALYSSTYKQILNQAGSFSRGPLSPIAISIRTLNDFILCVFILSLFIQLFWR